MIASVPGPTHRAAADRRIDEEQVVARQVLQPRREVGRDVECTATTVPAFAPEISPITSRTCSSY